MITGLLLSCWPEQGLDNQVCGWPPQPRQDTEASYVAWGHSFNDQPWSEVVAKTEDAEDIVIEIDLEHQDTVRKQVPISSRREMICTKLSVILRISQSEHLHLQT